ncbi:transcriptional regulator, ArsR family [Methanosalsum zhilinae DSM 4017]|uniref:Transcriptional regulator, ArsR family n=1 Tax=Methanosalsum zhilinae (strain DSM 4017 / NBRC 107636 / OCM 62 / WeN5) TaxID=679901 RepID=F7XPD1_METZD|nr:ArsR family transcriptional regulator [Methanosalsum zhilinae]AEH60258.1 transcriptional regulator, ArsR family [Methanosalsum zhilinae DSM 4017]
MDASIILDILGNENRRKILQILSNRPYYVSEISKKLEVGPKAIISHLSMLEDAGLVRCHIDSNRRKYFSISNNVYLDISLSPNSYVASIQTFSISQANDPRGHVHAKHERANDFVSDILEMNEKIQDIKGEIRDIVARQHELRAEINRIMDACDEIIEHNTKDPLEARILHELLADDCDLASLSYNLGIDPAIVNAYLSSLHRRRLIEFTIVNGHKYWTINKQKR